MKILQILAISACMVAFANAENTADSNPTQKIIKSGELGGFKGDSKIFSGNVQVGMKFQSNAWHNFSGAEVSFERGARTAWHSHPAGQILLVTKGEIYTGTRDGVVHIARAGDVIECPPNLEHWHGAGVETSGTHIALTLEIDGKNVVWKEKVKEEEYLGALKKAK